MVFNIGRIGQEDDALMRWPPRSPDLTPYDFFSWGFVKDTVFVPPLPANLQDLWNRITAALALVDRDVLTRVWNEMEYRIDVLPKVDTLNICEIYKIKLESFSLYRRKKYHDPLSSLFVANF